jgi:hypothetical protein
MPEPRKKIVAVVFDFDDTLAPDSVSQLLRVLGVDPRSFWLNEVQSLVDEGWDLVPAYLYRIIERSRSGQVNEPLTRQLLRRAGHSLELYPGVASLFERLRQQTSGFNPEVSLEFYVVSSGLQDLIDGSKIREEFTQVWACELHYDEETGEAQFAKNLVSFTDKTRYLFHIHKGLIAPRHETDPLDVNRKLEVSEKRIPFEQMIYLGDGFTDVPCFSLIAARGGIPLAVADPKRTDRWACAWGFVEDGRAISVSPADFRDGTAIDMVLKMALQRICERIPLALASDSA